MVLSITKGSTRFAPRGHTLRMGRCRPPLARYGECITLAAVNRCALLIRRDGRVAYVKMRSLRSVVAALILLLGVALALLTAIAFGDGAENVIHLALAATFLLLTFAVFDFRLPASIQLAACATMGALAAIFLLQGASDLMHSASLRHLAYDVLGQRIEKMLGYAFLLWCVAVLFRDSAGRTRTLGVVVLVTILCVEIYGIRMAYVGGETPGVLKLLYLPLFVWLLLEGVKPRDPVTVCAGRR